MKKQAKPAEILEREPETRSAGDARYSQPLAETVRTDGPEFVRAGFVGKGANKQIGFHIFSGRKRREEVAERTNVANERPKGFFGALAALYSGRL